MNLKNDVNKRVLVKLAAIEDPGAGSYALRGLGGGALGAGMLGGLGELGTRKGKLAPGAWKWLAGLGGLGGAATGMLSVDNPEAAGQMVRATGNVLPAALKMLEVDEADIPIEVPRCEYCGTIKRPWDENCRNCGAPT